MITDGMKAPCKACPDRHIACHDGCNKYKNWKEKLQKDQQDKKKYMERHIRRMT